MKTTPKILLAALLLTAGTQLTTLAQNTTRAGNSGELPAPTKSSGSLPYPEMQPKPTGKIPASGPEKHTRAAVQTQQEGAVPKVSTSQQPGTLDKTNMPANVQSQTITVQETKTAESGAQPVVSRPATTTTTQQGTTTAPATNPVPVPATSNP